MEINATLFGQIITFLALLYLLNRYLYEPVNNALEERRKKVEKGIEDGEKGEALLKSAKEESEKILEEANSEARLILEKANKRAALIEEEGLQRGKERETQLIDAANEEVESVKQKARHEIRSEVVELICTAAGKVVSADIDKKRHKALIDSFVNELK